MAYNNIHGHVVCIHYPMYCTLKKLANPLTTASTTKSAAQRWMPLSTSPAGNTNTPRISPKKMAKAGKRVPLIAAVTRPSAMIHHSWAFLAMIRPRDTCREDTLFGTLYFPRGWASHIYLFKGSNHYPIAPPPTHPPKSPTSYSHVPSAKVKMPLRFAVQ